MALGEQFESILLAAQTGAGWAFTRLYEELAPVVTGYLRLQGGAEPDDLASETFLGVFRNLSSFSGNEEQFRSWVFTIAHRRLIDERRRQTRRPATVPFETGVHERPTVHDVESRVIAHIGLENAADLLDELTQDQRDVLLLRIVADLTVAETAQALDKTEGSVKQLQRRGLLALHRLLDREEVAS